MQAHACTSSWLTHRSWCWCWLCWCIHTCPQVCFKDAFFSLLPRMRYGLFYNTPLVSYFSCIRSCFCTSARANLMYFTCIFANGGISYFQRRLVCFLICMFLYRILCFFSFIGIPSLRVALISSLVINMLLRSNIYVMYSKAQQLLSVI